MNKYYYVIITRPWIDGTGEDLIAAFTSVEALDAHRDRLNKTYKEWDITYVFGYPKEWIMHDYKLNDFDLIMHD